MPFSLSTQFHQVPEHLFAYCERSGDPSLWAEPLNAVTNLCFTWVAYLCWRSIQSLPERSIRRIGDIWILVIALFAIGIGSGLWHTYAAASWTVIADVIPIYIFINTYVLSLFRRLFQFSWFKVAAIWVIFSAINLVAQNTLPAETLNGSLMYVPTFGLMVMAAVWLAIRQHVAAREMGIITGLFTLSLACRTFDTALCDTIPTGTHFLWHSVNAIVLYRLVRMLMPR